MADSGTRKNKRKVESKKVENSTLTLSAEKKSKKTGAEKVEGGKRPRKNKKGNLEEQKDLTTSKETELQLDSEDKSKGKVDENLDSAEKKLEKTKESAEVDAGGEVAGEVEAVNNNSADGEAQANEVAESSEEEEHFDADVLTEFEKINTKSEKITTDTDLGLNKEAVDDQIKQALEYQSPKKKKRKLIVNLIFMLINIILMVFIVKGLVGELAKTGVDVSLGSVVSMQGNKLWWLAAGVLVYIVNMLFQTMLYKVLIRDLTGRNRWGLSYDVAVLGKYYDNVTPFAAGGQPMQIVRLAQNEISPGVSTSIPIIKMIMNNGINVVIAILFFIFGLPKLPTTGGLNDFLMVLLEILGVIGLILNVLTSVFLFLVSSGTLFTRSFVSGLLRLGYKMKIVKNYRQTYKKVINQLAEYKVSMSYLWKHKKLLFKIILLCVLECLSYASLPIFVMLAFSNNIEGSIWLFVFLCFTRHYICAMASSYIPLPGGTGMMEISFIIMFGLFLGDNIVWALLAWRFLTYYLIVLHGFVHELRGIITRIVKNSNKKKVT